MSSVESCDVLVVGARCTGSPLAVHLARAGLSTIVVDRADFPSDAFSTHLIQRVGAACLDRLGVLDQVRATGAPCLSAFIVDYDHINLSSTAAPAPDMPEGGFSVRREVLDNILVEAAREAGADVRLRTRVVDVLREGDRVTGVRVQSRSGAHDIRARLVVGADGRMSSVAKLVGARSYNVTHNERFVYWAEFEGAAMDGPPAVYHVRRGDEIMIGFFSDSGLFTVMVEPGLDQLEHWRADVAGAYDAAVARCDPLHEVLASATRVGRPIGTAHLPGFFRESAGPGWVLVGDAGHFKDPTLGQGIGDAFRQAEDVAAIVQARGLDDAAALDAALVGWWRSRDKECSPIYWLSVDSARAGSLSILERRMLLDVARDPAACAQFGEVVSSRRARPSDLITPARALRAAAAAIGIDRTPPLAVGRELVSRAWNEAKRFYLLHRPRFEPLPSPGRGAHEIRSDAIVAIEPVAPMGEAGSCASV